MSFSKTTEQIKNRSKTVTRRLGWADLRKGDLLKAVEKVRGRRRSEPIVTLGVIRVVDVRRERLELIDQADCVREGFPGLSPAEFVKMFCKLTGCKPWTKISRIEFEFYDGPA